MFILPSNKEWLEYAINSGLNNNKLKPLTIYLFEIISQKHWRWNGLIAQKLFDITYLGLFIILFLNQSFLSILFLLIATSFISTATLIKWPAHTNFSQ